MKQKQQILHIGGGTPFNSYEHYISSLKAWKFKKDNSHRLKRCSRNYDNFLDMDNYDVIRPEMPCKHNAKYLEWKI